MINYYYRQSIQNQNNYTVPNYNSTITVDYTILTTNYGTGMYKAAVIE